VLGLGCDGESGEQDILETLSILRARNEFEGCFSLQPMLGLYREQAAGLAHHRTPNIICNALEDKKLNKRKGGKVVIPRGLHPQIPLEWLKHGFVFSYKS
jgi:hypothetical protein